MDSATRNVWAEVKDKSLEDAAELLPDSEDRI